MNIFKHTANIHTCVLRRFLTSEAKKDIEKIIKNHKVVVFMKGVPEQPQCGFSNVVVQIFRMHGVKYEAFNVLEDDNLRQGKSLNI